MNKEEVIDEVEQLIIEHYKTVVTFIPIVEEFNMKWVADRFNKDMDKFEQIRTYLRENLK